MVKLPFFSTTKEQKPITFLTIDVGSDDVKAMCFEVETTEKGVAAAITGIGKQSLLEDSTRGGVIVDPDDVKQALSLAISQACNGNDVREVIFGVGGNLCLGLMTTVKIVRGRHDSVSERELNDIFAKIHEVSFNEVQAKLLEMTGNAELDVQMITSSVVYSKIDGKDVDDLLGLEGQNIEVAVFNAFAPTYHLELLQQIASDLGLNIVAVGSNMYSLVKSLGFSKGNDFDGVVMDIGGELTDVGVVFGGGILATKSLDIGGTHLTRMLAKKMDLSFKDANHKKLEYSYGRLPDSDNILIKGHLDGLLETWLNGVELLFLDFTGVKTFASNIYLVGGGAELPDVYDIVSKEPWARSIPFKSPPEFGKLTLADLPLITDKTGKAHALYDIVPASLSIVYLEIMGLIE